MFRLHSFLAVTFFYFSSTVFSQTREVRVNMDVPKTVTAGTSFNVTLTFRKGSIQSFSRLFQDLPAGLQATAVNPANSDFTFQDKRVRMIWFRLPETDTFSVVYSVQVDKRLKGTFTLRGTFSYIDNGERKSLQLPQSEITIVPSSSIDPHLIVDIRDFEKKVPAGIPAASAPEVFCLRNVAPSGNLPDEKIVTLLLYKGNLSSFGKIEDTIPAGYAAAAIERNEGLFTLRDRMVRYLWMNLPPEPWFIVSYRLTPLPGNTRQTIWPGGVFSYINQNRTFAVPVSMTEQPLAILDTAALSSLVEAMSSGRKEIPLLAAAEEKKKTVQPSPTASPAANKEEKKTTTPVVTPTPASSVIEKKKNTVETASVSDRKSLPVAVEKKIETADILPESTFPKVPEEYVLLPEKGVYFRIQIAATRQMVNMSHYFRRMKITDEIRVEQIDNWFKYTIGSFRTYEEAKKHKELLCSNTLLKDAFITAYHNGKRIPVQEAISGIQTSSR